MPARAWYDANDDLYRVELSGPPVGDTPHAAVGRREDWSMFTHGVCAPAIGGVLSFHKIAITGRHIASDTVDALAEALEERLEQAAAKLSLMGRESAKRKPSGRTALQCQAMADLLARERDRLVRDLVASHRQKQAPPQFGLNASEFVVADDVDEPLSGKMIKDFVG